MTSRPAPAETVAFLATDPSDMDRDGLRRYLRAAAKHRAWIEGRELLAIRALDELPKDPSSPAKDTAGEVGRDQNIGPGQAKRKTETAKEMKDLPETESALDEGSITGAHAEAMARARKKADSAARAALAEHEADLLDAGARETAWEFAKRLERFVRKHSADDGRSNWDRMKDRERFAITPNGDGMHRVGGLLHPETAMVVKRVLGGITDELYRRDHQAHPADAEVPAAERTNEHRMAEAFKEMARRAEDREHPASTHDRVVTILPYEDLLTRLGDGATLPDGTPIPADIARRMACTSGIIPMVLDGQSVPLDHGRDKRCAQPGQRVALGVLWATCSVADCRVPFEWCQIHHVDPFESLGRTDLARLTPACDSCHDRIHSPGWTLDKLPDGSVVTTAPDGTSWHRRPNRRRTEPPPAAAPVEEDPAATLFTSAA